MSDLLLKNLSMNDDNVSLKSINMNFFSGQIYTLIYKSEEEANALIDIMLRLKNSYEGQVLCNGVNILDIDEYEFRRNYVSAIIPENGLIRDTSVKQNMYLQMRMFGLVKSFKFDEDLLREKSDIAGVTEELVEKHYSDMTEEEYNKLILLKGLIRPCEVIIIKDIIDSISNRTEVYKNLKKLAEDEKISIVVFTKSADLTVVTGDYSLIDNISYLKRGRILTIK